ncbi:pentatricopeptide repeat-containing protein At5g11310, mitochondrial-like [Benincasa hispida]|uniref:pentatricopeptide repeat-containing protein At5g11310, mitochondrial-like n=1 Tax=Benincasa hispida TaxID=102211 RepID=UPI0019029A8A|nr:pentatricopeptide repeat-containing protein At5g11310, mitochondrial-like [Benincasa hispida]XP_038900117.1 pentatricopeptide repeat-containing protein At5g11310, mitochondrial-like [Benincasa hispida]
MLIQKPRLLVYGIFHAVEHNHRSKFRVSALQLSSLSAHSWLSTPGKPLIKWPSLPDEFGNPLQSDSAVISNPNPAIDPKLEASYAPNDLSTISGILSDHGVRPGAELEDALDRTGIVPSSSLLEAVFDHFDSSPKFLHSLFLWAAKKPGFCPSAVLFNRLINVLAKSREFDSTWSLIISRLRGDEKPSLVSVDVFVILIRRYARAGMLQPAIRTFEFACNLETISGTNSEGLFEILLDSLCKEGHVRVASEYFNRKREMDSSFGLSIRAYNILLNGWFRSRKLKHAERLWFEMKKNKISPTVVTYGTLIEGYCRMHRVERAIELVDEMRGEGIEPNAIIYNPIVDALGEAGRFKEALGMMERFMVLEQGPTISTYNSLVKGYCKTGDLSGASKILKSMISRGFTPTPTTYNYFFRFFSKHGKIEEGMNLYNKMIESGYAPDKLTYHLLLKMLCEEERLNLAVQVCNEMKARGFDMDLATSTMLIHLLCKMHKFEEAFTEFEHMIHRGIVPQYLTFFRLHDEFMKRGWTKMASKLQEMMSSVPHSEKLPDTYNQTPDSIRARRKSIMRKAEAMSEMLKVCKDPRELVKRRSPSENAVFSANRLMDDIKKKASL